ncbi:MAG: hypothetical protein FJ225_03180, partial [Lentisphaerae bacterium]|nr:hypothetical protein [Lentisphaerota bacterium]
MQPARDKWLGPRAAAERLAALSGEFCLVPNPSYVYPPFAVVPLAPRIAGPIPRLAAVVQDMDGTTTTTETLCLHSLETMVRLVTRRGDDWPGLDRRRDYPHIIGNSTTRHVEYLVRAYGDGIDLDATRRALLEAVLWTLARGHDPLRRAEAGRTLAALGWAEALRADADWNALRSDPRLDLAAAAPALDRIARRPDLAPGPEGFDLRVRAAIEIYYRRYHEILDAIAAGRGHELSARLTGGRPLIEPMPGVAVFLALVRGWLGDRAGALAGALSAEMRGAEAPPGEEAAARLRDLGRRFARAPARVAVVTSSIAHEARIVLGEVVKIVARQMAEWPAASELAARLGGPDDAFDAIITASDSSEIRLKPHRDLYSIALHALGVMPARFGEVIGLEDSESGTIAIRAAGVGLCVAVPFVDTAHHDLSAAAHILPGGLPQAILEKNLFL